MLGDALRESRGEGEIDFLWRLEGVCSESSTRCCRHLRVGTNWSPGFERSHSAPPPHSFCYLFKDLLGPRGV